MSRKYDALSGGQPDPLENRAFRKPGLMESLGEALFGFSRPLQCVQVEVSSACMGQCTYCPHTSQGKSWRTRHITPDIVARLWPLFKLSSQAHLQGWGEPLLHPRFMDYVRFAKKAGCNVSTTSCGLVMNEELARKLADGSLDTIAFSFAGTDAKSNSSRRKVEFEKVCHNIRVLQKARTMNDSRLEIHLAYLLLANEIRALEKLPDLMADLGVKTAVVSTLDYLAEPEDRKLAFFPEDQERISEARVILEDIAARAEKRDMKIHYALPGEKKVVYENGCRENIRKTLYVDADGDISPCIYLNVPGSDSGEKRRVFGNALKEDAREIWKKPEFKAFRQSLVAGEPDSVCLRCPKRLEVLETRDT